MLLNKRLEAILAVLNDPTQLDEAHALLAELAFGISPNSPAIASHLLDALSNEVVTKTLAALILQVYSSDTPALIFTSKGDVITANQSAGMLIDAYAGHNLRQLSLRDKDKSALQHLLHEKSGNAQSREVLQIRSPAISRSFTMVLIPEVRAAQKPQHWMAALIDLSGDVALIGHIAEEYGLTSSEKAVVAQFMAGDRLEDIALARGRSMTTIKSQFYTITQKFSVKSQADLLKALIALSCATDIHNPIVTVPNHPHRRSTSILRPHGRVVEVTLAGDMLGAPVVHIPTIMQKDFPSKTEKLLSDAGILFITIVQPGNGNTTIEPDGQTQRECSCQDITAVLDQLGIKKAILFGTSTILRSGVLIANEISDRISHILISSPTLPAKYEKQFSKPNRFFPYSRRFQALEPGLRNISVRLIWRTITTLQAHGMLRIFMRKDKSDLRACLEPDTLIEVQAAFDCVIKAGFDRFAEFYEMTFDDWQDAINDISVPITLYEGVRNRMSDPEILRQFQDDYANSLNIVRYDVDGTCLPYVRPEQMIEMIKKCQT